MKKSKIRLSKIVIIFIMLILIMSASVFLYATSVIENPITIQFEDKNLMDAIKNYFADKQNGIKHIANYETLTIEVSQDDVNLIEELNLLGVEGAKISDLTGIERFVNLKKINLTNNNITDMTPITELTKLISINLSNNPNVNLYDKSNNICYLPNQQNIEELNISSTNNSNISFVRQLPNLKTLNVSNNGISALTELQSLYKIESLDISYNTGITKIDDILPLTTLKELNIATTGIKNLLHSNSEPYSENEYGIFVLNKLENLNVENNKLTSIEPIFKTYQTEDYEEIIHLKNLKKLNLNYTGQSYINFYSLAKLKSLTHLYMKGNGITYIEDYIATLPQLEYINLSDNLIENIDGFVKYGYDEQGNQIIEDTLAATRIELAHNKIQDISPLGMLDHDIKYLDLTENVVFYTNAIDNGRFSFSEGLKLQRQGLGWDNINWYMEVTEKEVDVDQYIILPTLFQSSKRQGSVIYAQDTDFSFKNITLNSETEYQVPGYYNVVIDYEKTEEDELAITLHGGCADESTLYFKLVRSTSSIDSLRFKDRNLSEAVYSELQAFINEYTYVERALDILNITNQVIYSLQTLHLEDKEIKDLTGLASFQNLEYLYLSDNDISAIDELRGCPNLKELYLSNNINIGNNNNVIEKMPYLTKLDLSNTGLTNINILKNLVNYWNENYITPSLTYLSLSNNQLEKIDGIENINSLEELYISNIKIKDITKVGMLNKLRTLNASVNQIENIEGLKTLTNLKYLNISDNNIKNIEPISRIALDNLDFSKNRVKDVSKLTKSYTTLKMDSNQISDISNFENKLIQNFSVTNQKIAKVIEKGQTGNVVIDLPPIFKSSKESGSKVYTANDFILSNCELSSNGTSIIVNTGEIMDKIATIKINGGSAHLTTFSVIPPLEATITYNPSNEILTNQNITATISFNRTATIINNDGKNTYTFDKNGEFEFKYTDEYGFEDSAIAKVENIDKQAPQNMGITKNIVNKKVEVIIKINEPILQPEGWQLSSNRLSITKTYDVDTKETVELIDDAGNKTTLNIEIKIDKIAPKITGVENGKKYREAVTPVIEDENLDTVTLTKNGVNAIKYTSGTKISEVGLYVLTATDKFENTTTVSFEIEQISDIITSTEVTVIENTTIIKDIQPRTTVATLRKLLKADMNYEITDKNGNIISDTSAVGTGYKIKMGNNKIYTLIIFGDSNGDGQADFKDILLINKHRLNKASLTGEYLQAGDINKDGKADFKDILQINKFRLGKINKL